MQLPIGGRGTAADEATDSAAGSSGGRRGRKLLAALAVGGAAYLAVRRLRSSGGETKGVETPRDETAEPIEDAPGEERTPEEIAERVGDDVDAEPAEPGEMAIDEAVVEDAVDEAELSDADETDGDEDRADADEEAS